MEYTLDEQEVMARQDAQDREALHTREDFLEGVRGVARELAEKFHPIYVLLDWTWTADDDSKEVPTVDRIEAAILQLAERIGEKTVSNSTGGLCIVRRDMGMGLPRWDPGTWTIEMRIGRYLAPHLGGDV